VCGLWTAHSGQGARSTASPGLIPFCHGADHRGLVSGGRLDTMRLEGVGGTRVGLGAFGPSLGGLVRLDRLPVFGHDGSRSPLLGWMS
jgi:hypothetical protein